MALGQGFKSKSAFALEVGGTAAQQAYGGQASTCGAGDLIPLLSESFTTNPTYQMQATLTGGAGYSNADVVTNPVSGDLVVQGLYGNSLQQLITAAVGFEHRDSPENPAGSDYRHYLYMDDVISQRNWLAGSEDGVEAGDGGTIGDYVLRRGTFVIDKDVSLHEFMSVMFDRMTISQSAGQRMELSFGGVAHSYTNTSAVNTSASSWTNSDDGGRILFSDLTFRLGAFSNSTSLDSTNDFAVQSVSIEVINNVITDSQTTSSGLNIDEPARRDFYEVNLSFTIPRYQVDTIVDWKDANTRLMADLNWDSGSDIGGGNNYDFRVFLNSLYVTVADAQVAGSDLVQVNATCQGTKHDVLGSGIADSSYFKTRNSYYSPIVIRMTNGDSTNYLE